MIQFGLVRFLSKPFVIFPDRAKQQPSPGDFGIIPRGNDIRSRSKNQMEMVRKNCETKQIDPKTRSKSL